MEGRKERKKEGVTRHEKDKKLVLMLVGIGDKNTAASLAEMRKQKERDNPIKQ